MKVVLTIAAALAVAMLGTGGAGAGAALKHFTLKEGDVIEGPHNADDEFVACSFDTGLSDAPLKGVAFECSVVLAGHGGVPGTYSIAMTDRYIEVRKETNAQGGHKRVYIHANPPGFGTKWTTPTRAKGRFKVTPGISFDVAGSFMSLDVHGGQLELYTHTKSGALSYFGAFLVDNFVVGVLKDDGKKLTVVHQWTP
jgi:hypothetical protein